VSPSARIDLNYLAGRRRDVDGRYYGANWSRVDDDNAAKALLLQRVAESGVTFVCQIIHEDDIGGRKQGCLILKESGRQP